MTNTNATGAANAEGSQNFLDEKVERLELGPLKGN
jgi:hypothetical protein